MESSQECVKCNLYTHVVHSFYGKKPIFPFSNVRDNITTMVNERSDESLCLITEQVIIAESPYPKGLWPH